MCLFVTVIAQANVVVTLAGAAVVVTLVGATVVVTLAGAAVVVELVTGAVVVVVLEHPVKTATQAIEAAMTLNIRMRELGNCHEVHGDSEGGVGDMGL
jgi:hypothetical protein